MTENRLSAESSPYLLQHKDNPVHWYAWSDEAFAAAHAENKPILLSVGYAACHWCHVMAHESFEDAAIAAVMNRNFINIKVDREERPDLDSLYQSALSLLGEAGGWPLTMFLTPDAEPFWGGTYFPPTPRYGRPSFIDVLDRVAHAYTDDPDGISRNVSVLREALNRLSNPDTKGIPDIERLETAAQRALPTIDPMQGGTVGAPKFPQPTFFKFLWSMFRRTSRPEYGYPVQNTLAKMAQGGIYDHVGGGYARYSTDEVWLAPHFEKMLYDNALLVDLLVEVWRHAREPLFEARIRETVTWLFREMRVFDDAETFAFASSFDADSEGAEGRYYIWGESEIDRILGPDASLFKSHYDIRPGGNWEGHSIPNRSRRPELSDAETERRLAECRTRLLTVRQERVPPIRDDKVLAEWNGLMISALANASAALDVPEWIAHARTAYAFIRTHMTDDDYRIARSWRAGLAIRAGTLEDYGAMMRAALSLFEATAESQYLSDAEAWARTVDRLFADPGSGGYFQSAVDVADVIVRTKPFLDSALPSGNGLLAECLAKLFHLTGSEKYRQTADSIVRAFIGVSPELLPHMPALLNGYSYLHRTVQVVLVGSPDDVRTRNLRRIVLDVMPSNLILLQVPASADLPAGHPAAGKRAVNGLPTAYVCVGFACGLPTSDPEALRASLAAL